jgi:Domain of unknown function (DUF4157)
MSVFKPLQLKRSFTLTPVAPASSFLRPFRPLASLSTPASEAVSRVLQPQLERTAHVSYSLAHIPIDSPEKNDTGLPDKLKTGIESLSGISLDDVNVHYNSIKPGEVKALAYTQGAEIHVGPGQEKHLPHEAWHVVQQKEGRVKPTLQAWGALMNDDQALEKEAESMGTLALDHKKILNTRLNHNFMQASEIARTESAYQLRLHRSVGVSPVVVQCTNGQLVTTSGGKYKKKQKEREEEADVQQKLGKQISDWVHKYGHSMDLHVGMTTAALDARHMDIATTFETEDDLIKAAKDVITQNEQKLNDWYEKEEKKDRISLWTYLDKDIAVRGRRKAKRPEWHFRQNPMPPHPGYEDVEDEKLQYVIGIFDRSDWTKAPKGLVTCYPSVSLPK